MPTQSSDQPLFKLDRGCDTHPVDGPASVSGGLIFLLDATLAPCLVLCLTGFGQDLVTDAADGGIHLLALAGALAWLGLQTWSWARQVLAGGVGRGLGRWLSPGLPLILALAPFASIGPALLLVRGVRSPLSATILLGVGIGLAGVLLLCGWFWTRLDAGSRTWIGRLSSALTVTVAILTFFYICLQPAAAPAMMLGPSAVVILGISCLIPGWMMLIRLGDLFGIPASLALVALAAVLSISASHREIGQTPWLTPHAPLPLPTRLTLDQTLTAWTLTRPSGRRILLVAAEGGDARSALWTAQVLGTLEQASQGQFSRHLFAVSTVSGAGLGAAGFVAELARTPPQPPASLHGDLLDFVSNDLTSPALAGLLWPDLAQRFFAPTVLPDTAHYFEQGVLKAWVDHCPAREPGCAGLMTQPYLDLYLRRSGGWRPLLLFNGSHRETADKILTSPIEPAWGFAAGVEDFHRLTGRDVSLAGAIGNGVRGSGLIEQGLLVAAYPDGSRRSLGHLSDGGIDDNSGLDTVSQILAALEPRFESLALAPLVIRICYHETRPVTDQALYAGCRRSPRDLPAGSRPAARGLEDQTLVLVFELCPELGLGMSGGWTLSHESREVISKGFNSEGHGACASKNAESGRRLLEAMGLPAFAPFGA